MKTPKDIERYITPWLAALRLTSLAVERVGCMRRGVRVKWELKISYYYPPETLAEVTGPCIATSAKFTSGEEVPELTGSPQEAAHAG